MLDFIYQNHTKMIFGHNAVEQVGPEMRCLGKRVLILYGGGSCVRSGLLDKAEGLLVQEGITVFKLGGVQPNPRMGLAYSGIELCKAEKIEAILAIGGGSVIDTAKTIGMGALYEGDAWDFYCGTQATQTLPVGVILTIPAAGSESSMDAVMTKEEGLLKRASCSAAFLRPVFAVLNPELTMTLPAYQSACGAFDIMAHVMERYFTTTPAVDVTDQLCEALIRSTMRAIRKILQNPADYDARAEIMLAGSYAHNNLVGVGRVQDWASHGLGHEVSALTDAAHGATLAVMFPAWMTYVYKADLNRFAQFANRVMDVPYQPGDEEGMALEAIRRMRLFVKEIGLPGTLTELGVKEEMIPELVRKLHRAGSFMVLEEKDIEAIYRSAL